MLALKNDEFNELLKNIGSMDHNYSDFGVIFDSFVKPFFACFDLSNVNDNEKLLFDTYCTCIKDIFDNQLDQRNDNFLFYIGKLKTLLEHPVYNKNIMCVPFMILLKFIKGNTYLLLQHNNREQNNIVSIDEIERILFKLNRMSMVSDEIVRKYVLTTSNNTLLYANNFMSIGENDEGNVSDKPPKSNNQSYQLVFNCDDLNFMKITKNLKNSKKVNLTFNEFVSAINDDINSIALLNSLNIFYIREYLRPCIELYWLKMEEIGSSQNSQNFIKLIELTCNLHVKYRHELTRMLLSIVTVISTVENYRNYININKSDVTFNKNLEKLWQKFIPVINSFKDKSYSTNVGILTRICNELFENLPVSNGENTITRLTVHDNFKQVYYLSYFDDRDMTNAETLEDENSMRLGTMESQAIIGIKESFEIKKDGTIKIVLKGRVSLMDEYAANHRLLKLNSDTNDIRGMKYNLVYTLLLLESADRILHDDKISKTSQRYKDAEKAKSFCNNDIVTYLPRIKSVEPKFNLNEFYKQVRADQYTIEIDSVETISGIKKIVNSVIL